jgi:hypothetical protein
MERWQPFNLALAEAWVALYAKGNCYLEQAVGTVQLAYLYRLLALTPISNLKLLYKKC